MITHKSSYFRILLQLELSILLLLALCFLPILLITEPHSDRLYMTVGLPLFIAISNTVCFLGLINVFCNEQAFFAFKTWDWLRARRLLHASCLLTPLSITFKLTLFWQEAWGIVIILNLLVLFLLVLTLPYPLYIFNEPPCRPMAAIKAAFSYSLANFKHMLLLLTYSCTKLWQNPGTLITLVIFSGFLVSSINHPSAQSWHWYWQTLLFGHFISQVTLYMYLVFIDYEVCGDK